MNGRERDGHRPRVGISECLLGHQVRHDGGHKRDDRVRDVLGACFEWVAVCPEVEVGMGVPREPVRLVSSRGGTRMITVETSNDWTGRMRAYARDRLEQLERQRVRGFILKSGSPSCGMEGVRLYDDEGAETREGIGLFAAALRERFPNLPVEEEGRLADAPRRESFVVRVFTYDRWRRLLESEPSAGDVTAFHARHELLIRDHDPERHLRMCSLVAAARTHPRAELLERYEDELMRSLQRRAPLGRP